jgi:hypothetical protein
MDSGKLLPAEVVEKRSTPLAQSLISYEFDFNAVVSI